MKPAEFFAAHPEKDVFWAILDLLDAGASEEAAMLCLKGAERMGPSGDDRAEALDLLKFHNWLADQFEKRIPRLDTDIQKAQVQGFIDRIRVAADANARGERVVITGQTPYPPPSEFWVENARRKARQAAILGT